MNDLLEKFLNGLTYLVFGFLVMKFLITMAHLFDAIDGLPKLVKVSTEWYESTRVLNQMMERKIRLEFEKSGYSTTDSWKS